MRNRREDNKGNAGISPHKASKETSLNQMCHATRILMANPTALVQKLWNYCNILRDDGLYYGYYVKQLTSPLFLKRSAGTDPSAVAAAEKRRDAASTLWRRLAGASGVPRPPKSDEDPLPFRE